MGKWSDFEHERESEDVWDTGRAWLTLPLYGGREGGQKKEKKKPRRGSAGNTKSNNTRRIFAVFNFQPVVALMSVWSLHSDVKGNELTGCLFVFSFFRAGERESKMYNLSYV